VSHQLTNRFYWGSTALLSVLMVLSGLGDLFRYQPFVEEIRRLGYPEYLLTLLGIAKLFGVPALLYSGTPRLKEWAYAGFAFDLGGAAISQVVSRSTVAQLFVPTVCGLLLTASYITYRVRVPRAQPRHPEQSSAQPAPTCLDDTVGALVVPRVACNRLTR
jgi:hypothetical protein